MKRISYDRPTESRVGSFKSREQQVNPKRVFQYFTGWDNLSSFFYLVHFVIEVIFFIWKVSVSILKSLYKSFSRSRPSLQKLNLSVFRQLSWNCKSFSFLFLMTRLLNKLKLWLNQLICFRLNLLNLFDQTRIAAEKIFQTVRWVGEFF